MNEVRDVDEVPIQLLVEPMDTSQTPIISDEEKAYGKIGAVIVSVFLASAVSYFLLGSNGAFASISPVKAFASQFIGIFFVVFAFLKILNLTSFVPGFSRYDVFAKRWKNYAYFYPFIQLSIGTSIFVFPQQRFIYLASLFVSSMVLVGVVVSLLNNEKPNGDYQGNFIKIPLKTLLVIEGGFMFVISGLMVLAML